MCQQGDIVRVWSLDPQGHNAKPRRFVIVSKTDELEDDDLIVGVAISGVFPDPLPDEYVKLPWDNRGHIHTKLYKDSAAVCNWIKHFEKDEIVEHIGKVPPAKLLEIIKKLPALD